MADTAAAEDSADFSAELEAEVWVEETSEPSLVARMFAEVAGTFILVGMGVGMAIFGSRINNGSLSVGLGFGLGVMIAVVALGPISGAHLNPAVTIGVWLSGRFPGRDVVPYILAQVIGGLIASSILYWFASVDSAFQTSSSGAPSTGTALMSTVAVGYGAHSPAQFGANGGAATAILVALVAEIIATALLVTVVLGATSVRAPKGIAPFSIGLGFAVLIVWTIPFTNAALNPARATATALFADSWALGQLWLFWLAPIIGAAIVGLLFRAFGPAEDIDEVDVVELFED